MWLSTARSCTVEQRCAEHTAVVDSQLTTPDITVCGVTGAALCEGRAHSFQPWWKCKEMAQPLSKWVFTCWLSPLSYLTPLQPRAALFGFLNVFLALFGLL